MTFVSQTNVWSNEYSINSSENQYFFDVSTDEISFIPFHFIEDTKEIIVAENELEEEQKNKEKVQVQEFNVVFIELNTKSFVQYTSPFSYFSNHLYDLFCSWKSFIL